ncbi:MAG: hypothetical protein K0S20_87 [Patescibacteria group bacterium]|jgi:uncharacterized protein YndB with AHSA1/START domain|nr:hypothetical protein [Patescibacteria group bacterium]
MATQFIEKSVVIHASAFKVWQVFINPIVTRKMGGEYVSEWRLGSAIGWKSLDGTILTKGTILDIESEKTLSLGLIDPKTSEPLSNITYELREKYGKTTLLASEELTRSLTTPEYAAAVDGWNVALQALKEVAEK